jgi:hypothetical protein
VNNNLSFWNFLNQIFLSFFFKKPKKKSTTATTVDIIVDEDIAALEEAEYDAQVEQDDEGQITHDESTVLSIHDQAIEVMRAQGVMMTIEEEQVALNLFPKVSTNICMIF